MKHMSLILFVISYTSTFTWSDLIVPQEEFSTFIVDQTLTSEENGYFRSIQQAVNQAEAGDLIIVKEGTYHETVTIVKDGIIIKAFDPLRPPIIDGADQTLSQFSWEHVQGNIYKTAYKWYKPQLTPKLFNRYGGGESEDSIPMQIYEDDVLLRGYVGSFVNYAEGGHGAPYSDINELDPMSPMFLPPQWYKQDIRIPGRFMYNEREAMLYVWSAFQDDPNNHKYSIPVLENLFIIKAENVTISNLVLKNSAGSTVVVEDYADGTQIENCYFINNMYAINVKKAKNITIAHNFIQQKGMWERYWYYDCKGTVLWTHAIALEHYGNYTERQINIYGNIIHGYYAAILANGNVDIHDNILSNCMSTHINIDSYCPEVQIYRNFFHHVDDSSIGVTAFLGGPVRIYRNLFYHCGSLNKAGTDETNMTNEFCYFYHNTFALSDLISHHPYDYPSFGRHVYRNNIFHLEYRERGSELYWRYVDKDFALGWNFFPFINGPDADSDLYWIGPDGPTRYIAYFKNINSPNGYLYGDFNKMQRDTGIDPNGLQVDPLFRARQQLDSQESDALTYDTLSVMDYHDVIEQGLTSLLESQYQRFFDLFAVEEYSPAVDRGMNLPLDWDDVVQVNDGEPDIGAWELN
jgi:hypothetical protein